VTLQGGETVNCYFKFVFLNFLSQKKGSGLIDESLLATMNPAPQSMLSKQLAGHKRPLTPAQPPGRRVPTTKGHGGGRGMRGIGNAWRGSKGSTDAKIINLQRKPSECIIRPLHMFGAKSPFKNWRSFKF